MSALRHQQTKKPKKGPWRPVIPSTDSRLYARIRLEGPNQILFHETPSTMTKPGLLMTEKKPLELKEWMMDYILKVTGRNREDDIQFEYGSLRWSTETKEGVAKCRLVSDDDWDKPGDGCQVDSRRFECNFPCGTQ
ncbi:esterase family protein [Colletotrichum karsti]|uniref:Esterase family protein n=1 Tax=Colletotrichum karsti TaxID=1095194 RepID=A0A9P6I5Q7_9PEZI|nr:esterase family protein [Colletotrichum karsti]KAF9872485.1 esterase family protein [Colletotrichum karsti]